MTLDNGWGLKMTRPVGRPRKPRPVGRPRKGRPRTTNPAVQKLGFTMGKDLMDRFDALRYKKGKELGILLSRSQMLAMILKKEEEEQ